MGLAAIQLIKAFWISLVRFGKRTGICLLIQKIQATPENFFSKLQITSSVEEPIRCGVTADKSKNKIKTFQRSQFEIPVGR